MSPVGPASPACRVALIDAQTVSRAALPLLLPSMTFVGSFAGIDQFLRTRPAADVVVMDLLASGDQSGGDRLDGIRSVSAVGYRVLVHTEVRTAPLLMNALLAGARGIVHRSEPLAHLELAVGVVADGERSITTALPGFAEFVEKHHLLPRLSPRQLQLLAARARGEQFDSVASRLFITKKVAEEHWSAVATKFSAFLTSRSPADLERYLGLDPEDLLDWTPIEQNCR
ncbi:DNA-binding response regulator [Nakamurella silvestris]|nr:DNA-binding response regulator [Nakamurella silvestris]